MKEFLDFISISPSTIIISILNLLILYLILKKFLFAPIQAIIAKRQDEVSSTYQEAEKKLSEGIDFKTKYSYQLENIENERKEILEDTKLNAEKQREKLVSQANSDVAKMKKQSEQEIEISKRIAYEQLSQEITGIATAIAGKILEREVVLADHEKMVEDFVEQLEVIK